jgi:hypothetical protein
MLLIACTPPLCCASGIFRPLNELVDSNLG